MKKQIFLTAIFIMALSLLFPQGIKIAYIDTDRIMEESQATIDAQKIFAAEREQWERQLQEIDEEIEQMKSQYEARKLTLTESGKNQAQERIEAKMTERRRFLESIFSESGLAMQRNAELLEPIMAKLKDSIERIARDNDYAIIFDAVGGGILYAKPNLDITDIVIEELNKGVGK